MRTLRPDQARRIALGAQGLDRARPEGSVDVRHLRQVLDTIHVVQLDSVNVLARAHYLPFFSRLGPYATDRLDRFLWRDREAFEYLGHAASVMPMRLHPLLRHRMRQPDRGALERLERERPGYLHQTLELVRDRGPVSISDFDDDGRRGGGWWDWGHARIALECLYVRGDLAIDHRDGQFTLHYDLRERVIPSEIESIGAVPVDDAHEQLVLLAAQAHGVGTARDLADYWRMNLRPTKRAIDRLLARGQLEEVHVAGWPEPAYLRPGARLPRRIERSALLSPFDPVVWFRDRTERLFGFHYRIEIYTPAAERQYGYYVLPFLLGDELVARVDLKADRQRRRLVVPGAFLEEGHEPRLVARELADELRVLAEWLELDHIEVGSRGQLATHLTAALG